MYPRLPFVRPVPVTHQRALGTGIVLVIAGLFLTALGAFLIAFYLDFITLGDIMPGVYRDPSAAPVDAPLGAFVFIGFIVLFGLVSLSEGIWRICYRQSNKYLFYVLLGMGAIFIAAGILVKGLK